MILESLQDIVESKSWSASIGLSFDSGKKLDDMNVESVKKAKGGMIGGVNGYSIGGSDARHSKHVVERLSGLIGEEEARVVIAGALHLNGAMIAAAHKDENGVYTDHGNLVLKVGELFWQHIYDYDNGHTLGMSYSQSFGKKAESEGQPDGKDIWNLGGAVGGHDKEGLTKATIGLGDVTIGGSSEVPDGVNRDVSAIQEMETNYDVQTIKPYFIFHKMYYPTIDLFFILISFTYNYFDWTSTLQLLACNPFRCTSNLIFSIYQYSYS